MLRRLVGPVVASVLLGAGVPGARAGDAGTPGPAKAAATEEGFKSLVADVGLGKVGIILGIEVSRLARNNAD